ncbi:hypothetical protein [Lentzea sp. DG1S-22]|uniref:hypothetical protein n=1 Tax=Lentzea sp. DG1S-22 TaxID=3108822 RepID=UPI003FA5D707
MALPGLDLSAALVDFTHPARPHRGTHAGPSPVDRRKPGPRHHLVSDATGMPWPRP